ncbi:MAG: hypothetical protein AAF914_12760 [Pseudomonadota bacterium]
MKLENIVLIVVVVGAAAFVTMWLSVLLLTGLAVPAAWLALIPAALVGYVVWRVISDRLSSAEDDKYDQIEK